MNMDRSTRQVFSLVLALLLVLGTPLSVGARSWYLDENETEPDWFTYPLDENETPEDIFAESELDENETPEDIFTEPVSPEEPETEGSLLPLLPGKPVISRPQLPIEPISPELPITPPRPELPAEKNETEEPETPAKPDACPGKPEDHPETPATPDEPHGRPQEGSHGRPGHGGIHGNIHSHHRESLTVTLWVEGAEAPAYTIIAEDGSFTFEAVEPGTYILKISGHHHATREFTVTITDTLTELPDDLQVNLKGDLTGDGSINVLDVAKVYAHIRGLAPLTDAYTKACAKVTAGTEITITDAARLYAHVKGINPLF